jgi:hypothetical protein
MTAFAYLLSRFFNAVAEARMRQAEIDVRKHLSLAFNVGKGWGEGDL